MSGWIEQQFQKLRTKEQEYRAWLRETLEGEATDLSRSDKTEQESLARADVETNLQELYDSEGDEEGSGESTRESASEAADRAGGSSAPAPRAAHRRILIQRAEGLARRVATLDDDPSPELRRQAEQLADRLDRYLQDAPDYGVDEQEVPLDKESPAEKEDRDLAGGRDEEQPSTPDREEKDAAGTEAADSDPDTGSKIEKRICKAFIDWCNEAGAMVDRYYMFERRVREEHDDVEVTPIYQDTRASGVQLTYDADDVSSEFWLVEVDTHHLVFPQPRDATHFRTLDPLFESVGDASPETLSDVRPAVVRLDGSSYFLESSGLVQ